MFHIHEPGLSRVEIRGRQPEGITLLEMALPADNQELIRHNHASVSRLTREHPLFEPENDYRLVVATGRVAEGASVPRSDHTFVHQAYFHVVGPPGVGAPDQPPEQPAPSQTGITGLSDLRLYVEQTLPPVIPGAGDKLLLPRAFYRGYDVAVKFNVPHAELMYLLARRTHCGGCDRACLDDANVTGTTCSGGLCAATCVASRADCSQPAAPAADNGCDTNLNSNATCGTTCGNVVACTVDKNCVSGVAVTVGRTQNFQGVGVNLFGLVRQGATCDASGSCA